MSRYDKILIGGVESSLKDDKALLRVLEIDGGIGVVKGESSKTNLKFVDSEGVSDIFRKNTVNEILILSGSSTVFKGLCRIVRRNLRKNKGYGLKDGDFEVRIVGNNATWFDRLKNVFLSDLDWGVIDYDSGTVADGVLANPLADKFGYGLGKWGKWKNDADGAVVNLDLDENTFVGFIKFIIENGFKKIGYRVESDFLNEAYISLCMPFAMKVYDEDYLKKKYDVECVVNKLFRTKIETNNTVTIGNADGSLYNSSANVRDVIMNNPIGKNGLNVFRDMGRPSYYQKTPQIPPNAPNRFSYVCQETGSYQVYFGNEKYSGLDVATLCSVDVFVNAQINGNPNQGTSKGTFNLNTVLDISLNEGDLVDVCFRLSRENIVLDDIRWSIKWNRSVDFSRRLDIAGLLPKWNIGDILRGVIHCANLKFQTDELLQKVVFEPSDSWKNEESGVFEVGFYRDFDGENYLVNYRELYNSKRLINRLILSQDGEIEYDESPKYITMAYGNDETGSGLEDDTKNKVLEGRMELGGLDSEKREDYENPFFVTTYQLFDKRIKGTSSQLTPLVPFLGNFDYFDEEGIEKESTFIDVPRLLVYGGQRSFTNGVIKGGTIRMNGQNNYDLPALWTVNYNDDDGKDLSLSYGDEFLNSGKKINGLLKRFYINHFIRLERGGKYKLMLEWGVGSVSFRESFDYEGKKLILKKVEGYDGRAFKICKTSFDEDVFILTGDFEKISVSVLRNAGDVL